MNRTYFTDRDLGKKFPAILAAAGLTVERHGDVFAPSGTDEEWLEYCGTNGRIPITHNMRIRYVPNELAAVMHYKVGLLVVIGQSPFPDLARNFVATIAKIEEFLDTHTVPFIAKVYRCSPSEKAKNPVAPGSVVLWHPK